MVTAPPHAPVSDRRRDELVDLCRDRAADVEFLEELDRRLGRLEPFDASLFVATDAGPDGTGPPGVQPFAGSLESLDEDAAG